ncbi:MAG TPA: NACHT domain-containing protein, partial [Cyanophyceae cyanobacterium]
MAIKGSRSLRASLAGIRRANRAVMVFATKIDLAAELEISRATVQNFFAGKPIGRENFHKICQALKLPWHEIAELTEEIEDVASQDIESGCSNECDRISCVHCNADLKEYHYREHHHRNPNHREHHYREHREHNCDIPNPIVPDPNIYRYSDLSDRNHSHSEYSGLTPPADIVQVVRQQIQSSVQQQYSSLRVLEMSQPRKLNDIYVEVKLLEKINSRRWINITDLTKACVLKESDRPALNCLPQPCLSGIKMVEQHSKLMILGKPGSGKTTFLKQIILRCIEGTFLADQVPIFIRLRDFAKVASSVSLQQYIIDQFATVSPVTAQLISDIFVLGKAILLLDGLDEVRRDDRPHVSCAIRRFLAQFHANRMIITCRTAAQEYVFEQFTEVEIADFDLSQINNFVMKWFADKDASLNFRFVQALHINRPILELATSPVLLTLLCLVFEDSGQFPVNRTALYEEALQVLLKTWDIKRHIERSQVCDHLSLRHKAELLGQIALSTLEQGSYFFHQKELEHFIDDYLCNRVTANSTKDKNLDLDSEAILKSIEIQHGLLIERTRGIYSFPHFVFHEYLAARGITAMLNGQTESPVLHRLVDHISSQRWREVFLLTLEMMPQAERLLDLMKLKLDELAQAANLQKFLNWLRYKTAVYDPEQQHVGLRALYLELELGYILDLTHCPHTLFHSLDTDGTLIQRLEA